MAYPKHIRPIEKTIIDRIIKTALERGWFISLWEGEGWGPKQSQDYEAITADVHATDMTELIFRDPEKKKIGSVIFVHGNDEDVIHDHTDNPVMAALCA